MVKKVFSNSAMVAHVWAQRTQDEGRNAGSSIFFKDDSIYSYGHHFPLARFINNDKDECAVLINSSSYSVTTSKHQNDVKNALGSNIVNRGIIQIYIPNEIFRRFQNDYGYGIGNARTLTDDLLGIIVSQAKSAAKRRKPTLVADDINTAVYEYNQRKRFLEFINLEMPEYITTKIQDLQNNFKDIIEANNIEIEKEKIKREEALVQERIENEKILVTALPQWRNSEHINYIETRALNASELIYMRVLNNEEEIETSKGARFPIEHGKKAFIFIMQCRERGETWQRNGKTIPLGHFQIDNITPEGDVKAGCHIVKWEEIELIAKQLNLI